LEGRELLFLPRHGAGHRLLPSEINYRANIFALKKAGARQLVSVSAVGSLREAIETGHFALPNQYFDHTRGQRRLSFFGEGIVAHVSTAQATCAALISALAAAAAVCGQPIHRDVTYACWKDRPEEHVTVEQVIARFGRSIGAAHSILGEVIARHPSRGPGSARGRRASSSGTRSRPMWWG